MGVTDRRCRGLPTEAVQALELLARELAVRGSMVFLDGPGFAGDPPGLRTAERGQLMIVYLTDVRGERVVIFRMNWIG